MIDALQSDKSFDSNAIERITDNSLKLSGEEESEHLTTQPVKGKG